LPEVDQDVQEAYDWYEKQSIGLGEHLLLSIDAAIDSILRNLLHYSKLYKGTRKFNVKRFPFGVFYTIHKDSITVLAIVHLSRHPNTWKRRKISKDR
jgi:hypothetical protein